MDTLSIIIPTVRYSEYIDLAIESCFKVKHKKEIIVNINNTSVKEYEQSRYWLNNEVNWSGGDYTDILPMNQSINSAITKSSGEWLFLLSDDDMIGDGFLSGRELSEMSKDHLYMTHLEVIDEDGKAKRGGELVSQRDEMTGREALELFYQTKIHNHLSLFTFSRSLLLKVGSFEILGYPNGYYMDTVMHGKLLANSSKVFIEHSPVFFRRESRFQGSAKFYFDSVNDYFDEIVNSLMSDERFYSATIEKYGSRYNFKKKMLRDRFKSEWSKLNNSTYNTALKPKFILFYKHLIYWDTGFDFKMISFLYVLLFRYKSLIPKKFKQKIKSFLG
ncbi:Glycosyltransferase involved in cell wall bisynthesis [Reichenbachiella faecimaris]|uniref:Glycosyltransferase involved in cell wall bisynthesis n=1 Tax=Reichenbachiella faecimaris TaxID=692418 RepID=A0A1W2GCG9_REIFA|nr:glycosyltransferase [Reichenbachiella faecimaris]SMD34355.1 Glycosyltransferase involved in cell wall bisynthesis [Reichenbachiella faecimaris]